MAELTSAQIVEKDLQYYLPTFKRFPIAIAKGKGSKVWDADGNEYLDALSGIAVNNLGHSHPAVVEAIQKQAEKVLHVSNFYTTEPQARLAEALCTASGMASAFFTNSGAESVEGAVKFARKLAHSRGRGGTVIAFEKAFHGRTLATIAMGKKKMQRGFEPIPAGFDIVPWQDMEALQSAVSKDTAAIIIEPVQGEGGVFPVDADVLKELRQFCTDQDIVLIFDEVQCGMGRVGRLFAKDCYDVQPDIITLAKGLGGGAPIGAILANQAVTDVIDFGDHGTTFGGNPLVCAAALATLNELNNPDLLKRVRQKGEYLRKAFENRQDPRIKEIRVMGLMVGIEFEFDTGPLVQKMMELGVLANSTAESVLRLLPPLTISEDELQTVINTVFQALDQLEDDE
ncbi:MAG: aspartate aminotransferase family protein [Rubricoccaceae bacterium]|nr:aspartate aminotransferase family protein [Rubricoccaceae bacterium]